MSNLKSVYLALQVIHLKYDLSDRSLFNSTIIQPLEKLHRISVVVIQRVRRILHERLCSASLDPEGFPLAW